MAWGKGRRVAGVSLGDIGKLECTLLSVYPRVCGGTAGVIRRRFSQGGYPRVCGGTQLAETQARQTTGLSPRVRGNRQAGAARQGRGGSIPACAGEPAAGVPRDRRQRVYPRVCGGTPATVTAPPVVTGLSPRVRGNRDHRRTSLRRAGSIPACAGEPPNTAFATYCPKVYPRVCGGTQLDSSTSSDPAGLSPRVRGNLLEVIPHCQGKGSIPACAGEPSGGNPALPGQRVYPRVCGGTNPTSPKTTCPYGLSPRVRGNRIGGFLGNHGQRSIPACAGEPPRSAARDGGCTVYPRVCGGTGAVGDDHRDIPGLSPRVRGNLNRPNEATTLSRSIPACAGEPLSHSGPKGM